MDKCVIYDFETLGQNQKNSAVVSFALLTFDEDRFTSNPYSYDEIIKECKYIKFDVEEQVARFNRKISMETLQWWNSQGDEARKKIRPSEEDDQSILSLYKFITTNVNCANIKKSYSRGNTFDPMFLQYLMEDTGYPMPFNWYGVRDTRSMIEGMSFGMKLSNSFMPAELEKQFIKHDPCHDICMDVMRMQLLAQAILQ